MKPMLVTSFENPDIDGTACMIAYSELLNATGKQTSYKIFGIPHTEAQFVLDFLRFGPKNANDISDFNQLIIVDGAFVRGLNKKIDLNKVIEVIDHRKVNDAEKFPNATIQIELVGSCATLIAEKFKESNIIPSKESAALLYSAIVSNTLNFKGKITTERDKKEAEWLRQKSGLPNDFVHKMFAAKSNFDGDKLHLAIANDYIVNEFGNDVVGIAQIEMVGVKDLINNRLSEIVKELNTLEDKHNTDINFLSIIELEEGFNTFIATNKKSKTLLEKVLNIKFNNDVAIRNDLIMRKEIAPLLKEELELS